MYLSLKNEFLSSVAIFFKPIFLEINVFQKQIKRYPVNMNFGMPNVLDDL